MSADEHKSSEGEQAPPNDSSGEHEATPAPDASADPSADGDSAAASPKPKKKESGALVGVLGFVLALGGGFAIGQVIKGGPEDADAGLKDDSRYRVELRGDEPQKGADDALVTIIEFADYQCPYCAKAAEPLEQAMADHPGDVRLIYKHFPLTGHRAATPAAKAAWAAHQQGKFWEMHHHLFESQASLGGIESKAEEWGLDVKRLMADLASDEAASVVDGDMLAGAKLGVTGTPAFFVNGHRYTGLKSRELWNELIEKELDAAKEIEDDGVSRDRVYAKLMEGALTQRRSRKRTAAAGELDPEASYRVTAVGRPSLGPDDALVTVVIFSDFQCPYCARIAPTAHQLVEQHDDVRVVFRNLPIPNHPRAREAAKAALAAWEQGKFWEMHDLLFENQAELAKADFAAYATQLGLDADRFTQDMASAEIETLIEQDESLATHFSINSTPSAFVNGRPVRGAEPLATFNVLVTAEREKAQALIDQGTPRQDIYAAVMQAAKAKVE